MSGYGGRGDRSGSSSVTPASQRGGVTTGSTSVSSSVYETGASSSSTAVALSRETSTVCISVPAPPASSKAVKFPVHHYNMYYYLMIFVVLTCIGMAMGQTSYGEQQIYPVPTAPVIELPPSPPSPHHHHIPIWLVVVMVLIGGVVIFIGCCFLFRHYIGVMWQQWLDNRNQRRAGMQMVSLGDGRQMVG